MPKTTTCQNGCGDSIWFDWNAKAGEPGRSDRGKMVPLQVSEDGELLQERHNCPNSPYNQQQQQRQNTNSSTKVGGVNVQALEAVLGNTMDIIARIERLDRRFDEMIKAVSALSNKDDSQTENQEPEA